jgi:hypothetical protein
LARRAVDLVAANCRWEHDGQRYFDGEVEPCINGRTVETGAYFGVDVGPLVERLLGERLADGGALVVTSPNLRSFHRRVSFALGRGRLFDPPVPLPEADGTLGHVRLYARGEIQELLGAAGLRVVHWHYADWEAGFIASPLLRATQRAAARLAPPLGTAWLAVAARR